MASRKQYKVIPFKKDAPYGFNEWFVLKYSAKEDTCILESTKHYCPETHAALVELTRQLMIIIVSKILDL